MPQGRAGAQRALAPAVLRTTVRGDARVTPGTAAGASRTMRASLAADRRTRGMATRDPYDPHRDEPRYRPTRTTTFFIVLATLSATGLAWRDGTPELLDALIQAAKLLLSIAPVIAAALLLGGYVHALLPHEQVARWLGPGSGPHGYAIAMLGGIVTPALIVSDSTVGKKMKRTNPPATNPSVMSKIAIPLESVM